MTIYFFDPILGNNDNAGTSDSLPKRDASTVTFGVGDVCLLKAGTEWVAPAGTQAINLPQNNIRVGAYGAADTPPKINCAQVSRGINIGTDRSGWVIENVWIDNVAAGTNRRGITNITTGSSETVSVGGRIQGVKITNIVTDGANDCNGVMLWGDGVQILDSEIEDIATDGIWVRCRNAKIGRNVIRRVAQDDAVRGAFGDNIQFGGAGASDFSGAHVFANILDHSSSTNVKNALIINAASATQNALVEDNIVICAVATNQVGIFMDVAGATVRRNLVRGGDYGIFMGGNAPSGVVDANMVTGTNFGLRLGSTTTGTRVRHNAFVGNGVGFYGSANDATTLLQNNILFGNLVAGMQRHGGMTEDANVFFGNLADVTGLGGAPVLGARSLIADPIFIDPARPWLGLKAGSPCWGAGIPIQGARDRFGRRFPNPSHIGPWAAIPR